MEDDVGAELEGTLEVRGGEGVVDDEHGAGCVGDLGDGGDVGDAHQRIGRRLDEHGDGPIAHGGAHGFGISRVDVAEAEAQVAQEAIEEAEGAAVDVLSADDVIAGLEQLHERVDTGGAAGEGEAVRGALEGGDVPLQRLTSGVPAARVLVPFVLTERVLDVRGRRVDRGHDGAGERLRALSGVNGARAESRRQIVFKNPGHSEWLR